MGIDRSGTYLRGILVPDPRIDASSIVAKDDATVPSDYTEAGPYTGPAEPDQDTDLILRTSGTQSADGQVEIRTHRSGGVGIEDGGFIWKDVAAGGDYYGLDGPALVTSFEPLYFTTVTGGVNIRPTALRLISGKLLVGYHVSSVGVVLCKRFDPSDSTWTEVNLTPTGAAAGYVAAAFTMCQLASGRVMAYVLAYDQQQVDCYYSDDDGDTWTAGGYRVLGTGVEEAAVTDMRCAYSAESSEILLLISWSNSTSGKETVSQYASADLGTQFDQILDDWEDSTSEEVDSIAAVPMLGGGFCVVYVDATTVPDSLVRRRIGSAFDSIDTATKANPDSGVTALKNCTAWRDEHDVMWLIVADVSSIKQIGAMYRSLDQGDTWENASSAAGTHSLDDAASNDATHLYTAQSIAGRTALVTRWKAVTASHDEQSVGVLWYSGYTQHTAPVRRPTTGSLLGEDYRDTQYIAWGTGTYGAGWFFAPFETPPNLNWTTLGAGSESLVNDGALEVTTTVTSAAERYYRRVTTAAYSDEMFAECLVELDSGDGDPDAKRVAFVVRWGDNSTKTYEVEIRLGHDGYRVYDTNAAANVGAEEAVDFTTYKHVRVALSSTGAVKTWWSAGGHYRGWTEGPGGTGLTAGASGVHKLEWGHYGDNTDASRWRLVGACTWAGLWTGSQTDSLGESWSNPGSLKPSSFPSSSAALIYDGVSMRAVGGPTLLGETQQISTAYEHALSNALPSVSPSPSHGWRATEDNQSYELVFDLEAQGSASWLENPSIGVFLLESNLETCHLEEWNGAAWVNVLSLDSTDGFSGLPYELYGSMVAAKAGSPSNDRFSPHMMHAGDTIELDLAEGTVLRKVVSNSAGAWRASTKWARLRFSDADGTESASGTCNIRRRNFGGIALKFDNNPRWIRLRIPAQKVVSGKYEIGQLLIGPVFVFGLQYGNGWSYETASNVELNTSPYGARSSRVLGPRRRAVEVSWADQPQDTTRMWDSEPSPDYVSGITAADNVVATIADTAYQVLGLTERTDGSASPVVYLGRISRGVAQQLHTMDPEWVYGRITTDVASLDHVVGDEGVSAVVRTNRLRIEEEV